MNRIIKRLSSSQIIIITFAMVILTGAFLLMLPISSKADSFTSFMDALFTSTSAVCVTGLVVHDTASYWTAFGQTVILILIQIGGMGVITIPVLMFSLFKRRMSIKALSTMQDSISAHNLGDIVQLTKFIVKFIIIMELSAALIMAPVFCKEFGLLKGMWHSVFHSVSAFCNAGFDLMGERSQFSSLTAFEGNVIINLSIMLLIVSGGLGFLTWDDVRIHRLNFRRYRMQSKVIITTTLLLILLPAIYFFFFEFNDKPLTNRILASFFQSISPRTAGFNTVDLTKISEVGSFITIVLMLVGGSPGSTAGGMKTTTFAVMLSTCLSVFLQRSNTNLFRRRLVKDVISNASTLFVMYIMLTITGGLLISHIEDIPLLTTLYEAASAMGTVGLSLGITPGLGMSSRVILILLMYIGRVGGLTLIYSAVSADRDTLMKYPEEKIVVG